MNRRDLALAACIAVVGALQLSLPPFPDPRGFVVGGVWAHVFLVAIIGPVALRRRWPWSAFVISTVAALAAAVVGVRDNSMEALAYGVVVYSLVERGGRPGGRVAAAGAIAILLTHVPPWVEGFLPAFAANVVFYALVWGAGRAQRERGELADGLDRQNAALTRERELLAEQAVAAERGRIAVELERVVAHAMSTARAKVEEARAALCEAPERRDAALSAVEQVGRAALADMQRMVTLLREPEQAPDDEPAGDSPAGRSRRLPGTFALRSVLLAAAGAFALWLELDDLEKSFPPGVTTPLHDAGYLAVCTLALAALLLRGRLPGAAVATVAGAVLAGRIEQPMSIPTSILVVQIVVTYSLALRADRRLVVAAVLIGSAAWLAEVQGLRHLAAEARVRLLSLSFAATLGFAVRERERLLASLTEKMASLRSARDERARLAVEQERARVARDMHDSVGHALTLMVLQAEVARRHVGREGTVTAEALDQAERLATRIGEELGALQGGSPPAVNALGALVEQATAAGMRVELEVEGDKRPLGGGLESTLYRITQEALTNVRKHASGAPATVALRYDTEAVELGVVNGAGSVSTDPLPSGGNGLLAIQERVAVFGGEAHMGPRAEGGYEVRVRIPVEQ
jgi:signal transduction histidine kinase